jgi:RHS repeat-associated protein
MNRKLPFAGVLFWLLGVAVIAQQGPDTDPDQAPGYVDNVFHRNQVDSINLYNGQLTMPIALGPQYPIGPKLKFQLTLTYNSRVWEFGHPGSQDSFLYTPIAGDPALGIGWNMALGAIKSCAGTPEAPGPCYYGPDGSEHHFISTTGYSKTTDTSSLYLHFIDSTQGYEMWDGDGNHYVFSWHVAMFNDSLVNYKKDFGQGRDGWYLTSLSDPFGNAMTVSYPTGTGPKWTYTNSCANTQMTQGPVSNLWTPSTITVPGASITINRNGTTHMVSSVVFNSLPVNGVPTPVTYSFMYDTQIFNQACDGSSVSTLLLEEMTDINLPDGSSYQFSYTTAPVGFQGVLASVTLPTGGTIGYSWGFWSFYHGRLSQLNPFSCTPTPPPNNLPVIVSPDDPYPYGFRAGLGGPDLPPHDCSIDPTPSYADRQWGVTQRVESPGGTTTYTHYTYPYGETNSATGSGHYAQALTVVVFPSNVDGVTHAKAVLFWAAPKSVQPTVPVLSGDRTGADIEERFFDHDPRPEANGQGRIPPQPVCGTSSLCSSSAQRVLGRTYQYDDSTIERTNRRLLSETTCYGSSTAAGVCNAGKSHTYAFSLDSSCGGACTWEGNGRHYNVELHSGSMGNDIWKVQTVWTPANWGVVPPAGESVLPNLYNRRSECPSSGDCTLASQTDVRDEWPYFDDASLTGTGFYFGTARWDQGTGKIWARCIYPATPNTGVNFQEYTATNTGYVNGALPVYSSTCGLYPSLSALPAGVIGLNGDAFAKQHAYLDGERFQTRWMVNDGTHTGANPLSWYELNLVRDGVTGWITSSTDTAGAGTTYRYDALGRVTKITAPGESVTTDITYDSPTSTTVKRDGGGAVGSFQRLLYDGLGRLSREIRQTAGTLVGGGTGAAFALRTRSYDGAGNPTFISEWGSCDSLAGNCTSNVPPGTTSSSFDPFHRPQKIVGPSNSTYVAISRTDGANTPYSDTLETRTTCVGGTWSGTACTGTAAINAVASTRRDARARVTQATDPLLNVTNYAYNIDNKLTKVCQGASLPSCSGGQLRTFTYDKLGFEISETTPEKGTEDSNVVSNFDSLGNVRVRTEGFGTSSAKTHNYTYDAAGRLTKETVNGTTAPYLINCYDGSAVNPTCADGVANYGGGTYPKGKLTRRLSNNPLFKPVIGSQTSAPLVELFDYTGIGGRLSLKLLTTSTGEFSNAAELWVYNSLGQLAQHNHPRAGTSNVIESIYYTFGQLSSIGVSGNDYTGAAADPVAISVGYYPSGQIASYSATRTAGGSLTTNITADPSGLPRPNLITTTPAGFNTGTIGYDASGNILAMGTDSFRYDANSRLTSADYGQTATCTDGGVTMDQCFGYDAKGNLTSVAGANPRTLSVSSTTNRLSLTSPASSTYDGRGNLTAINLPGFIGNETLNYDARNRQIEDIQTGLDWQYLYNAADERFARVTAGSAGAAVTRREAARYFDQGKAWAAATGCSVTFTDVQCTDPDWGWIQTFAAQGMTAGCGGGLYCPDTVTDKQSMSVFLMRAEWGASFVPPACTPGYFSDLDCSSPYEPFAQKAVGEGVMSFCSGTAFCPTQTVSETNLQTYMSNSRIFPSYHPIPGGTTYTVRDTSNGLVTEFLDGFAVRDNIFVGNLVVASYRPAKGAIASEWQFHSSDHLGSIRHTRYPATGATDSRKYWPYGEQVGTGIPPAQRLTFASMERDAESSHMYDHARHHDFNLGRFVSPDKLAGSPRDPQSWNRYTYGHNNPMRYVDADGLKPLDAGIRSFLEVYFQRNLSGVRTHSGLFARLLSGIAGGPITFGQNIFLDRASSSAYESKSAEGIALIGHEVTHTIQYADQGFISFLIKYIEEYRANRAAGLNPQAAYEAISFEVSADEVQRLLENLLNGNLDILEALRSGTPLTDAQKQRVQSLAPPQGDSSPPSSVYNPLDPFAGTGFCAAENRRC